MLVGLSLARRGRFDIDYGVGIEQLRQKIFQQW